MAAITITPDANNTVTLARTTLTASDTLAYVENQGMEMYLANNTAGPLTVLFVGSTAPVSYVVPGAGGATLPLSAGRSVGPIAANTTVKVKLDDLALYLKGVVTVTGGIGITATVAVTL